MHILMIAAENGALRGGKVGGMGDVIRDVPVALSRLGHQVSVICPGYQTLVQDNPCAALGEIKLNFCGCQETVTLYRVTDNKTQVEHFMLEHPLFSACGAGQIYCNDHYGPFATDAHKFALFCAAVCECLIDKRQFIVMPDVIHLHDWHAALVAVLRQYDTRFQSLKNLHTVYTIHNLSLQGIRPLHSDNSSLFSWFPHLEPDNKLINDPRYPDCVNLMRCGLNLADQVHAVSPGYAREILKPSDPEHGFVGGEGLENDLQRLASLGKLHGILNGCEYPETPSRKTSWSALLRLIDESLVSWVAAREWIPASLFYAQQRVHRWQKSRKALRLRLVSVGRLTDQKVRLLSQDVKISGGCTEPALYRLLRELQDDLFIMLGSGDQHYEQFFANAMRQHSNFLFLQGFSEELADSLYRAGDLFLMPSSFEPCGISQMLAMRGATPCIVHHVGGLKDTVTHGVNGFAFTGSSVQDQSTAMLSTTAEACEFVNTGGTAWKAMRDAATAARFCWSDAVKLYLEKLYTKK
jgi:starch synthase